ncbi:MAG: hypothetical protein IKK52_01940 [Alphaproteobacteria bacterium]|nr:hypothetical protein [Alphaproteobacteria bacterium]
MKKYLLATVCALSVMMSSNVWAQENADETLPPPPVEHQMKGHRGDMQKELADKLQLTQEQRDMAKKIHEEGREKMKPLMEESKALHKKMDKLRQENMGEFEKILTDEQKQKFEEMKKEFRKEFHHKKPHHRHNFDKKLKDEAKGDK